MWTAQVQTTTFSPRRTRLPWWRCRGAATRSGTGSLHARREVVIGPSPGSGPRTAAASAPTMKRRVRLELDPEGHVVTSGGSRIFT
jgi:hypothetical protein